jgi:ubiquinone/menaquinone biosynthesis C-methylase UbiE
MSTQEKYLLGHSEGELARLQRQGKELEAESNWLLDQTEIQPGWHAVDLGCGPIGVLHLLSEKVGSTGKVLGLDLDERTIDLARLNIREKGLSNVEVRQANIKKTGLPKASFDIAHMRLVLVNVPEPEKIVTEMVSLVRPGGKVAIQEADYITNFCYPSIESWTTLFQVYEKYSEANGIDLHIGRRIASLMRDAGVVDINVNPYAHVYPPGHSRRILFYQFMTNVRDRLVEQGLISNKRFDEDMKAIEAHLDNPETLVLSHLQFRAWGSKPKT